MTWINGVLADGIISALNSVLDLMVSSFTTESGDGGLINMFLSDNISEFTGSPSSTSGSTTIWSAIETLSNNAIVPLAIFVLAIILMYELIQMVVSGNNFHEFDTSIFIRWIMKAVIGILLVSNVFYIVTNIFGLGTWAVNQGIETVFDGYEATGSLSDGLREKLIEQGTGSLLIMLILSFLLLIAAFLLLAVIILTLANRIIEIFMYLSISPIPMATMMNNDWGTIGKNWLKNILALAFQGFFIIVAIQIFSALLNAIIGSFNDLAAGDAFDASDMIIKMTLMLGYALAFMFTTLRSGSISKSVFAAS